MLNEILKDSDLNKSEKILLIYFVNEMDNQNSISRTVTKICKDLLISKPTAIKLIRNLENKGLIVKENNFHNGVIMANTYKIDLSKYK